MTNLDTSGQLYNNLGTGSNEAKVGAGYGSRQPVYAFPNYYLDQVIQETVSNPKPLPVFTGGELDAYNSFSTTVMAGVDPLPSCSYNKAGNPYTGIRCEYIVLNSSYVAICASDAGVFGSRPSGIAPSDWQHVLNQMAQECADVANVQKTFNLYNQIIQDVYNDTSSMVVPHLVDDIGLSEAQQQSKFNLWWASLLEGAAYTVLSGVGAGIGEKKGVACGVFANLLQMTVDTLYQGLSTDATNNSDADRYDLGTSLVTSAATLYGDLWSQLQGLQDQAANGENMILEDWGALQKIGPLVAYTGYNGLGIDPSEQTDIETELVKSLALWSMQQLLPQSNYGLMTAPAWVPQSGDIVPSNDYQFANLGALNQSVWDQFAFYLRIQHTECQHVSGREIRGQERGPLQKVMGTDILDNGGNLFEFFLTASTAGALCGSIRPSIPLGVGNVPGR